MNFPFPTSWITNPPIDPAVWYAFNDVAGVTTWNPADKNSNVVLSNGNLTIATPAWNGNHQMVRATNGINPNGGKVYWEIQEISMGAAAQNYVTIIGIALGGTALANGEYVSQLGQGVGQGYANDAAGSYLNGWTGSSGAGIASGFHCFAYDSYTGRLWWAPAASAWTGNPLTGATPTYTRTAAAIKMFPALSYLNVNTHTANFGPNFNSPNCSIVGPRQGGANCRLLLHCDMPGMPDTSQSALPTNRNSGASINTSLQKFGAGCLQFTPYAYAIVSNADPALTFGTGDFTVDLWFRPNAISGNQTLIDWQPGATGIYPTVYYDTNGRVNYYVNSANRISGSAVLAANAWHHYALTRSGTTTRQFVNGVLDGPPWVGDTNNYIGAGASRPLFGVWGTDGLSNQFSGYMDEIRILKGQAAWTANFTPPTAPYT